MNLSKSYGVAVVDTLHATRKGLKISVVLIDLSKFFTCSLPNRADPFIGLAWCYTMNLSQSYCVIVVDNLYVKIENLCDSFCKRHPDAGNPGYEELVSVYLLFRTQQKGIKKRAEKSGKIVAKTPQLNFT